MRYSKIFDKYHIVWEGLAFDIFNLKFFYYFHLEFPFIYSWENKHKSDVKYLKIYYFQKMFLVEKVLEYLYKCIIKNLSALTASTTH